MLSLYRKYPILRELTDKETAHSYLSGCYEQLFEPYRESSTAVLEIGVNHGGSVLLWWLYFHNAVVVGVDIEIHPYFDNFLCDSGEFQLIQADDYLRKTAAMFLDNHFDIIIDDGPHTLPSQLQAIQLYWDKLKKGGMLIIEDIQKDHELEILKCCAKEYTNNMEVYDLRENKGRYDDRILVLRKE